MAAIPPLRFLCLVCGDTIDVPIAIALGKQHGLTVEATVSIDDAQIQQHAARHTETETS